MPRRLMLIPLLLGFFAGPSAGPLLAASYRLDQGQASSDVATWYLLSPDGAWAVYTQDAEDLGSNELWKVRLDGGAPVRLSNGLIAVGWSASPVEISPDSSQVLFTAPQDTPGLTELYRVPLALDGPSTKVSGGNSVQASQFTPDGSHIVWIENAPPGGARLYSRPADGSQPPTPLSPVVGAAGSIGFFEISPDSARVVYRADHEVDERFELYSVPIAGGTVSRLCGTIVAGGDVASLAITADSTRVVYIADQLVDERRELFVASIAPPTGAEPLKLSGAMSGDLWEFALSPDGQRVVYRADQQLAGRDELYSVPLAGGTAVKLNPALGANEEVMQGPRIGPDSARAVFRIWRNGQVELWSVPTNGPSTAAVALDATAIGSSGIWSATVTPSSDRVVYQGDPDVIGRAEIWSVPIDGSGLPTRLNPSPAVGDWESGQPSLSPDGSRVFFQHSYYSPFTLSWSQRIYEAPVGGGTPRAISASIEATGSIPVLIPIRAAPDARRVVWRYATGTTSSQLWIGDTSLFTDGWESGGFVRWSAKRP